MIVLRNTLDWCRGYQSGSLPLFPERLSPSGVRGIETLSLKAFPRLRPGHSCVFTLFDLPAFVPLPIALFKGNPSLSTDLQL
jgi:hypothetical protein